MSKTYIQHIPEPKMTSMSGLFCSSNSPTPKMCTCTGKPAKESNIHIQNSFIKFPTIDRLLVAAQVSVS